MNDPVPAVDGGAVPPVPAVDGGKETWEQKEIDLAWDLVVRGLERQPEILGDLRGRTGTLLAAAGVVVSVVIGFFAADSSSIGPVSGILLLVGFLPAVLAVKECWLVLRPLGYDDLDTDLEAYQKLRPPDSGRAFELRTKEGCPSPSLPRASRSMPTRKRVWSRSTSAWKRVWEWRRALEKRLERSASVTRTADDSLGLTINQLYRKAQALAVEQAQAQAAKQAQDQGLTAEQVQAAQAQAAKQARAQYRWWRVTLNQRSVRRLRDVAKSAQAESTPEDLSRNNLIPKPRPAVQLDGDRSADRSVRHRRSVVRNSAPSVDCRGCSPLLTRRGSGAAQVTEELGS